MSTHTHLPGFRLPFALMSVDVNIDSGSDKDWIQDEIINKLKETVRKQVTTDHGAEETNYRSVTELSEGWVLGL